MNSGFGLAYPKDDIAKRHKNKVLELSHTRDKPCFITCFLRKKSISTKHAKSIKRFIICSIGDLLRERKAVNQTGYKDVIVSQARSLCLRLQGINAWKS